MSTDDKDPEWEPANALESLVMERTVDPTATSEQLATKTLKDNAPMIAQSLVHIALHSKSETTRLRSGQYILDRVLGRADAQSTINPTANPGQNPLEQFLKEVAEAANNA